VPTPSEGTVTNVTATLQNLGGVASGPLTAAFFAATAASSNMYIGSSFIPSIAGGGSLPVTFAWNTLGFTGPVTITAMVDPFNRLAESNEANNSLSVPITILSRPDLAIPSITLSDDEPVVGQAVTVTIAVHNSGETAAGAQTVTLYGGNPDAGGTLVGTGGGAPISGGMTTTVSFPWTPTTPGPHRLFARADQGNTVSEFDEMNNDAWRDLSVGFAGPIAIDAGGADDLAYTAERGYGYLSADTRTIACNGGSAAEETVRAASTYTLTYRFDHLLPSHAYHLDITLRDCDGSRAESVAVGSMPVIAPVDLSDHLPHTLSVRLDPALYRSHSIVVTVNETHGLDAMVAAIALHDIDYRYADSGHSDDPLDLLDPRYPGPLAAEGRAYGWLDGQRLASWGNLPGQSVRMDRADSDPSDDPDSELRYRFDGLNPGKRYRLALTFRQLSGATIMQKVRIDGADASPSFNLDSGIPYSLTIAVPASAYASDGSILVGIVRMDCATSEAQVNEIALEEETLPPPANPCQVTSTPYRTIAFGNVTIGGVPAPVGAVVQAISPRNDVVGCTVVGAGGAYPFMQIYGESLPTPGMQAREIIEFRVDGITAGSQPLLQWQNDRASHQVNLTIGAATAHCLWLASQWNLFSFRPTPLLPSVERTLRSIQGRFCHVFGDDGVYDCTLPPANRTLVDLRPTDGYWLNLQGTAGANLRVEGDPTAGDQPIPLRMDWNTVGYLPAVARPITSALASIDGAYDLVMSKDQTYDPAHPEWSDLLTLLPSKGYLIHATSATTLTYPATPAGLAAADESIVVPDGTPADGGPCQQVAATPLRTILYGAVSISGVPAATGARVEMITPRGEVAGCTVVRQSGRFGYVQVYGATAGDSPVPGFLPGEPIAFQVDGVPVTPSIALVWNNDLSRHEVNLSTDAVGPERIYLPTIREE
jgi:hypothetical protein